MMVVVVGGHRRRPATKVGWNSWLETSNANVRQTSFVHLVPFVVGGNAMREAGGVRRPRVVHGMYIYIYKCSMGR